MERLYWKCAPIFMKIRLILLYLFLEMGITIVLFIFWKIIRPQLRSYLQIENTFHIFSRSSPYQLSFLMNSQKSSGGNKKSPRICRDISKDFFIFSKQIISFHIKIANFFLGNKGKSIHWMWHYFTTSIFLLTSHQKRIYSVYITLN